jgi:hypothetical protein|tara:strand:- start:2125 stop:3015 length:891 start_codon:yes stop_codon:yes gene_type:complete
MSEEIVNEFETLVSIIVNGKSIGETWAELCPQPVHLSCDAVLGYLKGQVRQGRLKFKGPDFMSAVANCAMKPIATNCFRRSSDTTLARKIRKSIRTYGASGATWRPAASDIARIAAIIVAGVKSGTFRVDNAAYTEHFDADVRFLLSQPAPGKCWLPILTYVGIPLPSSIANLLTNPSTDNLCRAIGQRHTLWDVRAKEIKGGKVANRTTKLVGHKNYYQRLLQRTSGYYIIACTLNCSHKHLILFDAFRQVLWDGYDGVIFLTAEDSSTFHAAGAVFKKLSVTSTSEIKAVLAKT